MQKEELSITVVIPIFNEEGNIVKLYQELKAVFSGLNTDYELIFVNDGSVDGSLEVLKNLASKERLLRIISLSRNFGQTAALACGIDNASGKIIVLMDGDLQNDPKDIPLMIIKIQEGYDLVSGWRKKRRDSFFGRVAPSFFANKLISLLSGVHLHDYGCTLKAYRADVLKDIKLYGEMHRFIPIYAAWIGVKITEVAVNHRLRIYGRSKYNLGRSLKVILDLLTIKFMAHFRTKPIYVFGGSGIISILFSLVCVIMLIYNKLVLGISMIQSPFLILSALLVIIGVQSILMGLLAEMQMRTYFESLGKPTYYVKEKINI